MAAVVEQRHPAMDAEIALAAFHRRDRPVAAGADLGGHLLEGIVMGDQLAPLFLGLLFYRLPLFQIGAHVPDQEMARGDGQDDAHGIADIAAIAG